MGKPPRPHRYRPLPCHFRAPVPGRVLPLKIAWRARNTSIDRTGSHLASPASTPRWVIRPAFRGEIRVRRSD